MVCSAVYHTVQYSTDYTEQSQIERDKSETDIFHTPALYMYQTEYAESEIAKVQMYP